MVSDACSENEIVIKGIVWMMYELNGKWGEYFGIQKGVYGIEVICSTVFQINLYTYSTYVSTIIPRLQTNYCVADVRIG